VSVAGLVLAGGAGRRFGGPKALVIFDGERLVDRAVRLLNTGGCDPVVVVSGAAPLNVAGALVVPNPDWPEGMGSSLRAGLASLAADPVTAVSLAVGQATAVAVVPVDTPWLGVEAVRRVIMAHHDGAAVAAATYDGKRGHPVLLGRVHWEAVSAAAVGDVGARGFLAAHPELITYVPCDGTGRPDDVDTPADLH
jgi:CTP:molybdopterin cytidylyltransferase MocA